MFYCEECANKNEWPYEFWMLPSYGPCEMCHKTRVCVDVPCKNLPDKKNEEE